MVILITPNSLGSKSKGLLAQAIIHKGSIKKSSHLEFLVAWLGYEDEFNSWEPYSALRELQAMQDYLEATKELSYLI